MPRRVASTDNRHQSTPAIAQGTSAHYRERTVQAHAEDQGDAGREHAEQSEDIEQPVYPPNGNVRRSVSILGANVILHLVRMFYDPRTTTINAEVLLALYDLKQASLDIPSTAQVAAECAVIPQHYGAGFDATMTVQKTDDVLEALQRIKLVSGRTAMVKDSGYQGIWTLKEKIVLF